MPRPGASCAQGTQRLGLTPTAPLTLPRAAGRLLGPFPGRRHEVAGTPPERRTVVLNPKSPPSVSPPRPGERRCPSCATPIQSDLPFCGACGTRVAHLSPTACANCGRPDPGGNRFCPSCGHPLADPTPKPMPAVRPVGGPARLVTLSSSIVRPRRRRATGCRERSPRSGARAPTSTFDDIYLSPMHAQFELRDGALLVRDLGSRNGTWVTSISRPLSDGDLVLVGIQLLRFRRLGYPGPHPPEADATRRMGSMMPTADVAELAQLRADGCVRDMFHLSPGRTVQIGRESGDWVFPYDPTMSGARESPERGRGVLRRGRGQPERRRAGGARRHALARQDASSSATRSCAWS